MSNDSKPKHDEIGGDWDSALDEWDRATVDPALPEDKTPPPAAVAETASSPTAGSVSAKLPPGHGLPQRPAIPPPPRTTGRPGGPPRASAPPTIPDALPEPPLPTGGEPSSGLGQLFGLAGQVSVPRAERATDVGIDVEVSAYSDASALGLTDEERAILMAGSVPPSSIPAVGPKLHEPSDRSFSADGETVVATREELARAIFAAEKDPFPSQRPPDAVQSAAQIGPEPGATPGLQEAFSQRMSIAPPAVMARESAWSDERDAAAHLLDSGTREIWESRVAWLTEEAVARQDHAEQSQLWLVISELQAMLGEDEKALAAAEKAVECAPNHPLAHRQARAMCVRDRRWSEIGAALEREVRGAPTAEARAHSALFLAEIMSRVRGDVAAGAKQIDLAARLVPNDPRGHFEKLVRGLIENPDGVSKIHFSESGELAPLFDAYKKVGRIRAAGKAGVSEPSSPYEVLPIARAALEKFDTATAAKALGTLKDVRGLGRGAIWLAASLAAQHPQTRPQALAWVSELLTGAHPAVASRLLAIRAVEANDTEKLRKALDPPGSDSFSAAERVVLSILFQQDVPGVESLAKVLFEQPSTSVLGAAAIAALKSSASQSEERVMAAVGMTTSQASVALGRGVLSLPGEPAFLERVEAFREEHPESAQGRLMWLESEISAGRHEALIDEIGGWGSGEASREDTADRDRALATGLVAELAGDSNRAHMEYQRALEIDPANESCARALGSLDGDMLATRILEVSRAIEDPIHAGVMTVEVALRDGPAGDEYESHLQRAIELAPALPFAGILGERHARSKGDVPGMIEWIKKRRQASRDPIESAYDACREAMLSVEQDAEYAAWLLQKAMQDRPQDIALRELYERFSTERPADWVTWRVERAAELEGADKARLLLEAALQQEREGVTEEAGKLARDAVACGAGELARLCAERCELAGAGSALLADALMEQARAEDKTARERAEARERLAELDEFGRQDLASALLWHRAILEEIPSHLPSLRRLEHAYVSDGREEELEPIASQLVRDLTNGEADAHAMVAARIRMRELAWASTRDLVDAAAAQPHPTLWALRELLAHACSSNDDRAQIHAALALAERTDREAEVAVLLQHAAEGHARLGELREAAQLLSVALEREPNLLNAHRNFATLLQAAGDPSRAAEELENLARKLTVPAHRVALWHRAALLWLDEVKDPARGRRALEEAVDIDIAYGDVFSRLQAIYTEAGDRTELAVLLERRIDVVTDPRERVEMEVLRGKALADVGDRGAAKQALMAALDASPDHVPALQAYSDLCLAEEDWEGAEQALIRLARHVPDVEQQASIYRQLGRIYLDRLPNDERAELVLLEVLKRHPDDADAQVRLVDVYTRTGNAQKAVDLCEGLLQRATKPEEKRDRTIQLAHVYEQVVGDTKKAEALLERVYKETPTSVQALRALAEHHVRQDHQPALKMLLDRAANDARRSLNTGRFNPELFAILAVVGELRGQQDAALLANAALGALNGEDVDIGAGGDGVFRSELDEHLAPPLVTESLRNFLMWAGDILDAAFPVDLKALRAGKLPPSAAQLEQVIQNTASVFHLSSLEVFVSPAIGPTCMPVSCNPPRMVLGASLVAATEEEVRNYLIIRALKILQVRGAVLSRTAPIDLLPIVSALIKTFMPNFIPPALDQKRFDDALQRIKQHVPPAIPPEMGALAVEVSGLVDNRLSTLNVAINGWGDRAALLSSGSLLAALKGIAWAAGHPSGPPASGPERATWIGRNAEARELMVFVVSDAFLQARARLGIGQS